MFPTDRYETHPDDVYQFCNVIRGKPGWVFQILDESKGFALRWALEAQLLRTQQDINDETLLVVQALHDLKAEASRIVAFDYTPQWGNKLGGDSRDLPFSTIDRDVSNALKVAREGKHFFTESELREKVGVFVTDDFVPKSLQSELCYELALIAQQEPQDIHPGSGGKVHNLIHPSLYPYVAGVTPVSPGVSLPPLHDGKFKTTQISQYSTDLLSRFAWIPSIFHISPDGLDVHIEGYINGLGPRERYPRLYRLLEKVFLVVFAQLERTIGWEYSYEESASERRWMARDQARYGTTRADWLALLASQSQAKQAEEAAKEDNIQREAEQRNHDLDHASRFHALDNSAAAVPGYYRNQRLKVIAANYVLQPGQEYEGAWHVEGMPHEQIVASGIYYYDTDLEIKDRGLSFRRRRDEDDFPSKQEYRQEDFGIKFLDAQDGDPDEVDYPSDWEEKEYDGVLGPRWTSDLSSSIELGTVQVTGVSPTETGMSTGRIVTFPNWIQHKVAGISHSSTDPSAPAAVRKILCFFLIDENQPRPYGEVLVHRGHAFSGASNVNVLTTVDVPSQVRPCNVETLHASLLLAFKQSTGREIPVELRNHIVYLALELEPGKVSREQAEQWRRELIDDRRIKYDSRSLVTSACAVLLPVDRIIIQPSRYSPSSFFTSSNHSIYHTEHTHTNKMGANLSKALGKLFGNKEMRLLMLGLDAAGKTTILYKLKLNQSVTTIPTVGFNVETVTYKNVKFNVWDVGGQDKIRPLWRHYYTGTQGLVFVVDSQDRERVDEAKQELHRILSDREMKECLLLVFANKQDLPGAMSPAEVTEKLGLHRMRDRSWYVHPSCATTGEGLFEGLQWLSQNVKKRQP
ncbi:hypothetical protein EYR40_006671 [Pleurotus pulmonarius]|nr:hypothetical protein EYR40_006671 [Pleurotus pulmonarius]